MREFLFFICALRVHGPTWNRSPDRGDLPRVGRSVAEGVELLARWLAFRPPSMACLAKHSLRADILLGIVGSAEMKILFFDEKFQII